MFINDARLVARNELARASRADLALAVADKNVEDLGATDAIEDIDVELLLPARNSFALHCGLRPVLFDEMALQRFV